MLFTKLQTAQAIGVCSDGAGELGAGLHQRPCGDATQSLNGRAARRVSAYDDVRVRGPVISP